MAYNKFKSTTVYGDFTNDTSGNYIANSVFKGDLTCNGKLDINGTIHMPYVKLLTGQTITSNFSGYFVEVQQGAGSSVSLFSSNALGIYNSPNALINIYNATGSSLTLTVTTFMAPSINLNPILYYPFNTDYLNYASSSGVATGTRVGTSAQISNSVYKYGTGSLTSANSNSSYINASTTPITNQYGYSICFWVRITSNVKGRIFTFNADNTTQTGLYMYYNSGNFCFSSTTAVDSYDDFFNSSPITLNTWYHIGVILNTASQSIFFINGIKSYAQTNFPYVSSTLNKCYICGDNYGNVAINGNVDEFYYFDGCDVAYDSANNTYVSSLISNLFNNTNSNYLPTPRGGFQDINLANAASLVLTSNQTIQLFSNGYQWIVNTAKQGIQGIHGLKGDTGLQGIAGVAGIQGIAGAKGDTGLQGIAGTKGDTGSQGIQGPVGTFSGTVANITCSGAINTNLLRASEPNGNPLEIGNGNQNRWLFNTYGAASDNKLSLRAINTALTDWGNSLYFFHTNGQLELYSFIQSSDYRIKENVLTLDDTHIVDNLRPVSYYNIVTKKNEMGFIAHEVQEQFPNLVNQEKDCVDGYQSLNYIGLIPVLVKEIQSLKSYNRALEERLSKLENNIP